MVLYQPFMRKRKYKKVIKIVLSENLDLNFHRWSSMMKKAQVDGTSSIIIKSRGLYNKSVENLYKESLTSFYLEKCASKPPKW